VQFAVVTNKNLICSTSTTSSRTHHICSH